MKEHNKVPNLRSVAESLEKTKKQVDRQIKEVAGFTQEYLDGIAQEADESSKGDEYLFPPEIWDEVRKEIDQEILNDLKRKAKEQEESK